MMRPKRGHGKARGEPGAGRTMTILILVCALSVAPPDCQRNTAIHSFYAPGPQLSFTGCLREGTLYAAQSRLVTDGAYFKVFCTSPRAAGPQTTEY
jgi:hypothetical protein